MSFVSVYRIDESNIGDMNVAPFLYFPFLRGESLDIGVTHISENRNFFIGKNVIVGGGGLLDYDFFKKRRCVELIPELKPRKTIIWGAGTNREGLFPDYSSLYKYDLVGCRDWGTSFEWVPCASCMSELFDEFKNVCPSKEVVAYWNKSFIYDLEFPVRYNSGGNLSDVLKFIASGETVITNSYHGAYWATLLGRKVVVVEPFSTKFLYMRQRPVITNKGDLRCALKRAFVYRDAIYECRDANIVFASKVREAVS